MHENETRLDDIEFQVKTIGMIVEALCIATFFYHLGLRHTTPANSSRQRGSDSMGGEERPESY